MTALEPDRVMTSPEGGTAPDETGRAETEVKMFHKERRFTPEHKHNFGNRINSGSTELSSLWV